MRDGISMARKGRPAVAIVMTDFWSQGNFVARAAGMPDVPRVEIPVVAGAGHANMDAVATSIAPRLRELLWGA